jgi:hypothetical protein
MTKRNKAKLILISAVALMCRRGGRCAGGVKRKVKCYEKRNIR